jgi:hypothetical protein
MPPPHHLAADPDDLLSTGAQVVGDVAIVLVLVRRRHQQIDALAEHIGRTVAEHSLRRPIEHFDDPPAVDDDDRVHRRIDDRTPSFLADK